MSPQRNWKKTALAVVAAASMGLLAACGSGGDKPTSSESGDTKAATGRALAIWAGGATPFVSNFNPYSPTALAGTTGSIYQPLYFYNKVKATDPEPLLAESYEWAEDGLSLTIKLRAGLKWNNGEAVTADDVAFSFTNSAVQTDYIDKADVVDDSTVKLTFKTPSWSSEYSLLGATYIVPKSIFGAVDDLVTFDNATDPVGTGPYMVSSVTDASYTMTANPNYWDTGKPEVKTVQYLGIDGNSSGESLLKAGEVDYVTMFVPQPDALTASGNIGYIKVSSPNPIVVATCANADLGCTGAQTDKAVRQAFNKAINRTTINEKAYYNLANPASPAFIMPGRDDQWLGKGIPLENPAESDVAAAKSIMEAAGYTLGADGIYEKDGTRASFTLNSVEGWSDANAAAELMVSQAKEAGIEVKSETITQDQYSDNRLSGKFEMVVTALFGTAISDPYTIYRDNFTTSHTQKVGTSLEAGQTNYARYSNEIVDKAVETAGATGDDAVKKEAYDAIQQQIVEDLPYISMFHGGNQTFFNDVDFTGWPSEDNLYAFPAAWDGVSAAYIMSHLSYAK